MKTCFEWARRKLEKNEGIEENCVITFNALNMSLLANVAKLY